MRAMAGRDHPLISHARLVRLDAADLPAPTHNSSSNSHSHPFTPPLHPSSPHLLGRRSPSAAALDGCLHRIPVRGWMPQGDDRSDKTLPVARCAYRPRIQLPMLLAPREWCPRLSSRHTVHRPETGACSTILVTARWQGCRIRPQSTPHRCRPARSGRSRSPLFLSYRSSISLPTACRPTVRQEACGASPAARAGALPL